MMFGWRFEEEIFWRRRWIGMQSKALERSMDATVVRLGGRFWLKPLAMEVERLRSEDVVEWRGLKPC